MTEEKAGLLSKSANPKRRYGDSKVPLWIVPVRAIILCAKVLWHGAVKYGPFNWRKEPISYTTYMAAIQRHLFAWYDGEEIDPESGLPHMAHVMSNAALFLDAQTCGQAIDDRDWLGHNGGSETSAAELLEKLRENIKDEPNG